MCIVQGLDLSKRDVHVPMCTLKNSDYLEVRAGWGIFPHPVTQLRTHAPPPTTTRNRQLLDTQKEKLDWNQLMGKQTVKGLTTFVLKCTREGENSVIIDKPLHSRTTKGYNSNFNE